MKQLIIISFAFILILNACRKKLDIEIPKGQEHIVVNGITTNDSLIEINISKSQDILNNDSIENITNASVKLYEGENFIENLTHLTKGNYISSFTPQIGNQYKILISSGELKPVNAKMQLYEPTQIVSIDTTIDVIENNYDFGYSSKEYKIHYKIKLNDNANKNNYYFLALSATNPRYDYETDPPSIIGYFEENTYYDSNDIIFNNANEFTLGGMFGLAFNDEMFNGQQYSIDISTSHYFDRPYSKDAENLQVKVKLLSISEDIYRYIVSYNLNQETEYDPFAQPVQVFTNIENGLGLFSGYTMYVDSLTLDFMTE